MKILVIGHAYIAPINREKWKVLSQKHPDSQIKILIPKNWPATLFKIEAGDLSKDNLQNCEFISLKTFKSGNEVLYGFSFFKLIKILKSFKPDIIHVEQGDNAFSYFQIILLSKIFCRKAKFTFFTWVNWRAKRSLKYKLFWRFIEKFNLYYSDGAFVGNDDAKVILREKKFNKPTNILLQLGVNEKLFYPAKKINKIKKIGFIGRIVNEKGIYLLVDAFAKIADKFYDWNLVFIGDGQAKKDLINYVYSNKLEQRVEFRQPVPHEKISLILGEIEVLVLPSYDTSEWREQFGHVLIEAMACKTPVVGSTGGYISQVIENSGLVFKQKDIEGLVDCLTKIMGDEKLRKHLGDLGFERFKENFSYEVIADKTYSFWRSLTK